MKLIIFLISIFGMAELFAAVTSCPAGLHLAVTGSGQSRTIGCSSSTVTSCPEGTVATESGTGLSRTITCTSSTVLSCPTGTVGVSVTGSGRTKTINCSKNTTVTCPSGTTLTISGSGSSRTTTCNTTGVGYRQPSPTGTSTNICGTVGRTACKLVCKAGFTTYMSGGFSWCHGSASGWKFHIPVAEANVGSVALVNATSNAQGNVPSSVKVKCPDGWTLYINDFYNGFHRTYCKNNTGHVTTVEPTVQ